MNPISEQLRTARESKHLSINDVAALTHINRRYITALETGKFELIPKAYLRSFIRTYAKEVDLSADAIFLMKENETSEIQEQLFSPPVEQVAAVIAEKTGTEKIFSSRKKMIRQDIIKGAVLFSVLIGFVFLVTQFNASERASKTEKIPFEEVIKENERIANQKDSLRLSATASDSVWLIVKTDGKQTTKSILGKNERTTWSAKQKFSITASDAGKVSFTLNNRFLGVLGKEGTIVRNLVLDKNTLQLGTMILEKEDEKNANQ